MIDFDTNIKRASEEIDSVADGLDEVSGNGPRSMQRTAGSQLTRSIRETLLPLAQQYATEDVGGYANEIDAVRAGRRGGRYVGGLDTDSTVVLAHEFGSGVHNQDSSGLVNANGRTGYRIGGDGDEVAFEIGGETVIVDYVIHPGVEAKGFMARALQDSADDITEDLGDAVADRISEAIR
jgi:hypothetical protein